MNLGNSVITPKLATAEAVASISVIKFGTFPWSSASYGARIVSNLDATLQYPIIVAVYIVGVSSTKAI